MAAEVAEVADLVKTPADLGIFNSSRVSVGFQSLDAKARANISKTARAPGVPPGSGGLRPFKGSSRCTRMVYVIGFYRLGFPNVEIDKIRFSGTFFASMVCFLFCFIHPTHIPFLNMLDCCCCKY
jgi:hypothetical protein